MIYNKELTDRRWLGSITIAAGFILKVCGVNFSLGRREEEEEEEEKKKVEEEMWRWKQTDVSQWMIRQS